MSFMSFLISGSLAKRFCWASRYLITIGRSLSICFSKVPSCSMALRYCPSKFTSTPFPDNSALCCSSNCFLWLENSSCLAFVSVSKAIWKAQSLLSNFFDCLLKCRSSSFNSFLCSVSCRSRSSFSACTQSKAALNARSRTSFSCSIISCSAIFSLCCWFCRSCRFVGICSSSTRRWVAFWRKGFSIVAYFFPSFAVSSSSVRGKSFSLRFICCSCSSSFFFSFRYSSGVRSVASTSDKLRRTPNKPSAEVSSLGSKPCA